MKFWMVRFIVRILKMMGTLTWTIMVSILSGLNLSLYLEREWASPSSIAVISLSGNPVQIRI